MEIIKYQKQKHKEIIKYCVSQLKIGKVIVYPTDTSYGLACDPLNKIGVAKLYRIKQRPKSQPVHMIGASTNSVKKLVSWNLLARLLSEKFWPGPLSLVLKLKKSATSWKQFASEDGFLGIRLPANEIARSLAKGLDRPITATSANLKATGDSFDVNRVTSQFENRRIKPDLVLDAGRLKKTVPSTMVKVDTNRVALLRKGQISWNKIEKIFYDK